MLGALPFFVPRTDSVYATGDSPEVTVSIEYGVSTSSVKLEDKWILSEDGETVYKVSTVLGKTSGYGKYTLGQHVCLSTTANDGYMVVGYRIDETIYTSANTFGNYTIAF